jgi:hypothetical protein
LFSSTGSSWASNRTEFQPFSRHMLITDRLGQWSRCSETGTGMSAVIAVHIPYRTSAPIDFTVLTEVCTIRGDRSSVAASRTAWSERSLTMLMAGTP